MRRLFSKATGSNSVAPWEGEPGWVLFESDYQPPSRIPYRMIAIVLSAAVIGGIIARVLS